MAIITLKENRAIFGSAMEAYAKQKKLQEVSLAPIRRANSTAEIAKALINTPGDIGKQLDAALNRMAVLESRLPS